MRRRGVAALFPLDRACWPRKSLRQNSIFANEIKLIWPVQPLMRKYFTSVFQKYMIVSPHPVPA
jgi:hypothetical protein